MSSLINYIKAYTDLTRIHFFFAWPLLFLSGLFLSFPSYGRFSWELVIKCAFIALLGFEAGFIPNDIVDRKSDTKDVDVSLTKYWRLFGERPIPSGKVSTREALLLFIVLVGASITLITTLPDPNRLYVLGILTYSYIVEIFYQLKKRKQKLPIAQLIGRTDFALFPVAGYLANGQPDITPILFFLFFYPFAQAHLGMNDLADLVNDEARKLNTVSTMYGISGTVNWIQLFTALHLIMSFYFLGSMEALVKLSAIIGAFLLVAANVIVSRNQSPKSSLNALPLFHITMLIYTIAIIVSYFI